MSRIHTTTLEDIRRSLVADEKRIHPMSATAKVATGSGTTATVNAVGAVFLRSSPR